jgi:P-type Ca2+ transporter type 2C
MITGDNQLTAKAIAQSVGIFKQEDTVLVGTDVEKMSDKELTEILQKTSVVARALPEHKYRIVKLLQKNKEIVAVTGDGVNDVPAIKSADLGIAMGNGSEAAKSVSKMILIDNNIKIIVNAIKEGRIIADNIKKVIYYLLTSCLSQIFLVFATILLSLPLPLYPIHILWINLVADGVQDKTFPFIKEEGNVMKRKPKLLKNLFFDVYQIRRIITSSIIIVVVNLGLFLYMINKYPFELVSTTIFTSMVFSQWVNGIHAQKEHEPFFKNIKSSFTINPLIWVGVFVGLILQTFAVFVFNKWFNTVPLGLQELMYVGIVTLLVFVGIEMYKWIKYFIAKKTNDELFDV